MFVLLPFVLYLLAQNSLRSEICFAYYERLS